MQRHLTKFIVQCISLWLAQDFDMYNVEITNFLWKIKKSYCQQ